MTISMISFNLTMIETTLALCGIGIVIACIAIIAYYFGRSYEEKKWKFGYADYANDKMSKENAELRIQIKCKDDTILRIKKEKADLERRNATSQGLIKKAELTLTPGYDMVGNIR